MDGRGTSCIFLVLQRGACRSGAGYISAAVYNHNGTEIIASYSDDAIYLFDNVHNSPPDDTSDGYIQNFEGHINHQTGIFDCVLRLFIFVPLRIEGRCFSLTRTSFFQSKVLIILVSKANTSSVAAIVGISSYGTRRLLIL